LLFKCPIAEFIKTIASNELKVNKEYDLVDIVRKCFEWHERKGVKVPVRPEDACAPEVWYKLSEAERAARYSTYSNELEKIKFASEK